MTKALVELDAGAPLALSKNFNRKARRKIGDAVERVGRKMELTSKLVAPHVSGNLKRQIDFKREGTTGMVRAKANYSAFVHGPPFHHGGNRKITPFFTIARDQNQAYAEAQLAEAVNDAVKASTK